MNKNALTLNHTIRALLVTIFCTFTVQGQTIDIAASFDAIGQKPLAVPFQNTFEIPIEGGHLQGIQKLTYRQAAYFFLSGSSAENSYYTIVRKTDKTSMVISNNIILEKPFKHAGGFQIFENLLAIGVEDNEEKTRSKVFIFQIDNPERPPEKPLAIIDRFGTSRRGTAGCVAISQVGDKVLVIVGDWDTVNLDFYVIERDLLGVDPNALILEYSLNSRKIEKSSWIDSEWHSYQNINLFKDSAGQLVLAGTTTNQAEEDILDLYLVYSPDLKSFSLQKIYSRSFGSNAKTKFRWGAGLHLSPGQIQILATPEHIHEESTIHIYE
jgi:hypothetical protein